MTVWYALNDTQCPTNEINDDIVRTNQNKVEP